MQKMGFLDPGANDVFPTAKKIEKNVFFLDDFFWKFYKKRPIFSKKADLWGQIIPKNFDQIFENLLTFLGQLRPLGGKRLNFSKNDPFLTPISWNSGAPGGVSRPVWKEDENLRKNRVLHRYTYSYVFNYLIRVSQKSNVVRNPVKIISVLKLRAPSPPRRAIEGTFFFCRPFFLSVTFGAKSGPFLTCRFWDFRHFLSKMVFFCVFRVFCDFPKNWLCVNLKTPIFGKTENAHFVHTVFLGVKCAFLAAPVDARYLGKWPRKTRKTQKNTKFAKMTIFWSFFAVRASRRRIFCFFFEKFSKKMTIFDHFSQKSQILQIFTSRNSRCPAAGNSEKVPKSSKNTKKSFRKIKISIFCVFSSKNWIGADWCQHFWENPKIFRKK